MVAKSNTARIARPEAERSLKPKTHPAAAEFDRLVRPEKMTSPG